MPDAIATLTGVFEDPSIRHGGTTDHARPVAVLSWPAVPVEIVRAAGLRPVILRGDDTPTPRADQWLEPDVFPNRLRQLVERALAGHLRHAACIILPRTSDADYKTFLYLCELTRRGAMPAPPPILLFDLLQSASPEVPAHNAARVRELFETLGTLRGQRASDDELRAEIALANRARAALRRLLALREPAPRVSGCEVLPLLGAFWRLAPDEYAVLATEAADALEHGAPRPGPRLVLTGSPVDGLAVHAALESLGAVVVSEPGPWGSDAPGGDVSPEGDPYAALAERYRRDAVGPRAPAARTRQRPAPVADGIDAVVVVLPPDDGTFGWDYPPLRVWLESRGLPHVCLTADPCRPLDPADRARLLSLIASLGPRVGVAHG